MVRYSIWDAKWDVQVTGINLLIMSKLLGIICLLLEVFHCDPTRFGAERWRLAWSNILGKEECPNMPSYISQASMESLCDASSFNNGNSFKSFGGQPFLIGLVSFKSTCYSSSLSFSGSKSDSPLISFSTAISCSLSDCSSPSSSSSQFSCSEHVISTPFQASGSKGSGDKWGRKRNGLLLTSESFSAAISSSEPSSDDSVSRECNANSFSKSCHKAMS